MGGGHDHTLPFLKLRRAEYNSQKEDGKMEDGHGLFLFPSWGPSITPPSMLPQLAVGSGIGVVEAVVSSRAPVLEGHDLEVADEDVLFNRWRVWSWSPSIPSSRMREGHHGLCLSLPQECGVEVTPPFPNQKMELAMMRWSREVWSWTPWLRPPPFPPTYF